MAHRRIVRRTGVAASLIIAALTLSGCDINNAFLRFGWPEGVTEQAKGMRELWTWSVIAALIMGVLVWGLQAWTVIFHRKKADSPEFPRQTGYNVPLELSYTVAPFLIIAVLFYFTVKVQDDVHLIKPDPAVAIDVTAYQWNWQFGYRGVEMAGLSYDGTDTEKEANDKAQAEAILHAKNEEGEPRPGAINGISPEDLSYLHYDKIETVGTSTEIPVLVLPVGQLVQFDLASADVIHSFWVPDFLFKRDVNPQPERNKAERHFQVTIEKPGAFVGRCAEMCGAYHSMMNFEVRAVAADKFVEYIKFRDENPLSTNGEALAHIGEAALATSTKPFPTKRDADVVVGK